MADRTTVQHVLYVFLNANGAIFLTVPVYSLEYSDSRPSVENRKEDIVRPNDTSMNFFQSSK